MDVLNERIKWAYQCSQKWEEGLYQATVEQGQMNKYLDSSKLFKNKKLALPSPTADEPIHTYVHDLLVDVFAFFKHVKQTKQKNGQGLIQWEQLGVLSKGIQTTGIHSICVLGRGTTFPNISCGIKAASQQDFNKNLLALFEIQPVDRVPAVELVIQDLARSAYGIFLNQPTRNFVRILSIGPEWNFRLVQFDKLGVFYTKRYNLQEDSEFFVRLVLGLASTDPKEAGFDNTITWRPVTYAGKPGVQGKLKARGMVNSKAVEYAIVGEGPVFRGNASLAVGRDTMGWEVVGKGGKHLFVKDSWRWEGSQAPEYEFLKVIKKKKIEGVVRMISCEVLSETRAFRKCHGHDSADSEDDSPGNRIKTRTVTEMYGPSINMFETVERFLGAMHDAIQGHRNLLLSAGILHRDISVNNVLLGQDNAKDGWRGVLIDFDLAVFVKNDEYPPADSEILIEVQGTRVFQSVMVLHGYQLLDKGEVKYHHDHLDDLEGFFYLFCFIIFRYTGPDGERQEAPSELNLDEWYNNEDIAVPMRAKSKFINKRQLRELLKSIPDFWGEPCRTLFRKWHKFVQSIVAQKKRIVAGDSKLTMGELRSNADAHYKTVLGFLAEAIEIVAESKGQPASENPPVSGAPLGGSRKSP
ncbi:hypothetical protein FA15DRAFT_654438 [Coprinopsis marcescibilis]|uniref:Fungal-type protein kinase domain-containing protein n=1 Tax=Coprinopsis marcescibilis TaxID=230819 RepID=A0A5C3KZW8_COPMA|nr:hypothetical protein FA15DRAFT_654438 [Coprinopsis marcescibilis]